MGTLGAQRKAFFDELEKAFDIASFETFLSLHLGKRLDDLSPPAALPQLLTKVVQKAEEQSWLSALLTALKEGKPGAVGLHAVIDAILKDWSAAGARVPGDPYNLFLTTRGGFVNRESTRAILKGMHASTGNRIVLLRGGAGAGKTHTWHFLNTVAKEKSFPAIYIDFVKWQNARAKEVMGSMAEQLDADLQPKFDEFARKPRQTLQLAEWFAGAVKKRGVRCWVFFDHLDKVEPPPEVMGLVRELMSIADSDLADIRLVIVGLREDDDVSDFAPLVDIAKGVQRDDVARFFHAVGEFVGAKIDDAAVEAAIVKIYAPVAPGDKPVPARELTRRIGEEALRLFPGIAS
ncbi:MULTISPECIES: effector-associated domain EAD1-containing protein [Sorangium]|uniref:Effector-associated domain-containing protein n=1 Tax=Sorangium cellulosum (strain So ce56) TaxID=448385 RepID=A9ERS2_SORC5|nr:effector-associated domain EAD1-containing protein [Sorangium cellulosum]CAN97322.1 hypothetical protein predicted by Glimmer/Critica [Sorangium cellulosum So ce56]